MATTATPTMINNSENTNNFTNIDSISHKTNNIMSINNKYQNSLLLKTSANNLNSNINRDTISSMNLSSNTSQYGLADIYEDAAVIGSELEKIISNYGSDVLKDLMPKVINVLELLENLTIKNEKENDELNELRIRINCLEVEKTQRLNEREKFEKELEEIEEKWKQETLKLIGMVNKLKDENKRLNESLNQNNLNSVQNDQLIIKQEELDYIRQIKEENIKLKESIRYKDREIEQKNSDNEALQSQMDSLSGTMLNFRRKQILAQNQIEKMVKSKTELECALTEKEHQINILKERLHNKSINSEEAAANTSTSSNSYYESKLAMNEEEKMRSMSQSSQNGSLETKDPNRPRFTLKELQKVLMEKNELTIKLDQTQDELEQLRRQEAASFGDVQGPINREPDEKLDPSNSKQNPASSGIRRFFSFFFSSSPNDPNEETTTSTSNEQQSASNGFVFLT